MYLYALGMAVGLSGGEMEAPQTPPAAPVQEAKSSTLHFAPDHGCNLFNNCCEQNRAPFQSDHCFDTFIGPISNPILSKDPRSNTYLRPMFINNNIPSDHALGGGSAQVYALQANIAINERLSIIADKDGLARVDTAGGFHETGWLNLAAGLKYTFLRDVENQTLAAAGFMIEIPTGGENLFQYPGGSLFTTFLTAGQRIGETVHLLNTFGFQFPTNTAYNSSFLYNSFHIDKAIGGWFYPLAELNVFYYTGGGDRLPNVVGEGDGLLNFGTVGVTGNTLVTVAFGAKAKLSCNLELGAAYEFPITDRKDLIENRLVTELIIRY